MQASIIKSAALAVLALTGALALSGCVQVHLSDDFGSAVRQDIAAQIADPDPHYIGSASPGGSDGPRVAAAQDRYEKGKVIPPVGGEISTVTTAGSGGPATPTMAPAQ